MADSHIRFPDDDIETYPSNALMLQRNEFVVDICNRIDAAFVVHLGDIVHPLPVEKAHERAVELAVGVYRQLKHPIHFVAGNHDIGDKPNALVAVPPVAVENYQVFERHWGSPYGSFDVEGLHFITVDTPVLNSGLDGEHAQKVWLEDDLAKARSAGRRIFMFTHYPPFIRTADENEHYDNLGEPARSWLLDLIHESEVEAVFSGHVHNFVYNHLGGTEFYALPSTGFVRPDYSELAAVLPESENGRDDPAKLGFFVVDVNREGHEIRPIRTDGATTKSGNLPVPLDVTLDPDWVCPIGVTLRHAWMSNIDFPTAGLDEFGRKTIRNDATLPALWEARINNLRIPLQDGADPVRASRLEALARRGSRFTLVTAGLPNEGTLRTIWSLNAAATRWEIAVAPEALDRLIARLAGMSDASELSLAIGPITPIGSAGEVQHFVTTGFSPHGDPLLERWIELDTSRIIGELVFRVSAQDEIVPTVAASQQLAENAGRKALILVELPRATEATFFDDDAAISTRVAETVSAARDYPTTAFFLDGFMDHDRSYYPRHGLIDRHHNPRPALYRLIGGSARK